MIKDYRLLTLALCVWLGGLCTFFMPSLLTVLLMFGVSMGLLLLMLFLKQFADYSIKDKLATFLCIIMAFAFSFIITSYVGFAFHPDVSAKIGKTVTVTGTISSNSSSNVDLQGDVKCSAVVELSSLREGRIETNAHFFIRVFSDDSMCKYQFGETISARGKVTEPLSFSKEAFWMNNASVTKIGDAPAIEQFFNDMKARTVVATESIENKDALGLMFGMSFGDKQYMSKTLITNTANSSLSHLTAVSGTHLVILIAVIQAFLFALRLPNFVIVVLQIVIISFFTMFVHSVDSIMRAAFMSIAGLLSIFFKRPSNAISALSAGIIALILLDPFRAISYGFILSCLATFAIIVFSGKMAEKLERVLAESLGKIVAIPLVATIFSSPIIYLMNGQIQLLGVISNILVSPFVSGATIFGILSTVTSFIPSLSAVLGYIGAFFSNFIVVIANAVGEMPFAAPMWLPFLPLPIGFMLMIAMFVIMYNFNRIYRFMFKKVTGYEASEANNLTTKAKRKFAKFTHKYKEMFALQPAIVIFAVVILILPITGITAYSVQNTGSVPKTWMIGACKVGQGDANLIRTGANSAILVDTGPDLDLLTDCMDAFAIHNIDLLVLTHFHSDHVAGTRALLDKLPVKQALVSPVQASSNEVKDNLTALDAKNIPYHIAEAGETATIQSGDFNVKWEVLQSKTAGDVTKMSAAKLDDAENNSSIALFIEATDRFGGTEQKLTEILLGDLESTGQSSLLGAIKGNAKYANVDVLKVAHHGSKTQNKDLAKFLAPKVAIYDVGKNTFGHPNPTTVELFESLGAVSLDTFSSNVGVYAGDGLVGFR
ncbi:MAG: ComEC/Rec2 family competence protein [Bifidobacteriaceae bacterium]|jgi:competence protein ComEC|nr:ComEC/Rec2 family competence protein [Bifidobacteriaceae bacterium]